MSLDEADAHERAAVSSACTVATEGDWFPCVYMAHIVMQHTKNNNEREGGVLSNKCWGCVVGTH